MDYRIKDMTGKRYGKLVGLRYIETRKGGAHWEFQCDCGNKTITNGSSVRLGRTTSCGCFGNEQTSKMFKTHGMAHSRTYNIWDGIKQRCLNPSNNNYQRYGGSGIEICEEWLVFENFLKDMGEAPKNYSIDRIDNSKGYQKDNCRWVNRTIQQINKRYKNNTTGMKNICHNKRDDNYEVGFCRYGKRYRKSFKSLEDAIQWRDTMLKELEI